MHAGVLASQWVGSRTRSDRVPRRLRGGVLAVVALLLGSFVHTGGGVLSHPAVFVPLAALTAVVGVALSGDGLRPLPVIGVLGCSLLAMRVLLVLTDHRDLHFGLSTAIVIVGQAAAVVAIALPLAHADTLLVRLGAALTAVLPIRWLLSAPAPTPCPVAALPIRPGSAMRWLAALLVRACPHRGPPRTS
ncbi:hypothetical protein AB0M19_32655 [Streptomyces sp. NPDC051920]|uniref:hypothetical protein n=1 Tax=Streptomyces sp. NPDC051920 TaxID=3155523 RepID=UPI00341AA57B